MRCPVHDLALSPSGECVLCRRPSTPEPSATAPLALLVCVLLGAVGTVLVLLSLHEPRRIASQEIVPLAPLATATSPEASPAPSATIDPEAQERAVRAERARVRRAQRAREAASRTVVAEVPVAPPLPTRPERIGDAPSRSITELTEIAPAPHALAAARRRVSITMYGAPWCGYCRRAERWLRASAISFVLHDVDAEPSAAQRLRTINPRGSVPVFEIDGDVIVGYSESALERAIDRAAARHM